MTAQSHASASNGHAGNSLLQSSTASSEAMKMPDPSGYFEVKTWILFLPLFALSLLSGCGERRATSALHLGENASTEIIGGTNVSIEDPLSRSIVGFYNATAGSVCTATIIAQNILLTASHCLNGEPSDFVVIFGTNLEDKNVETRKVVNFVAGPLWEKRNAEARDTGDIGLVRFEGALPRGYEPAILLRDPTALQDGRTVTIAGYGLNDGRRKTGTGQLRKTDVTIKTTRWAKTEIVLDQTKGKGACHGDSGGPAFIATNGQTVLWGATSRGLNDPRDTCGVYSAFTNVIPYLKWIQIATRKLLAANPATAQERFR